jgi:hypothetical protein
VKGSHHGLPDQGVHLIVGQDQEFVARLNIPERIVETLEKRDQPRSWSTIT